MSTFKYVTRIHIVLADGRVTKVRSVIRPSQFTSMRERVWINYPQGTGFTNRTDQAMLYYSTDDYSSAKINEFASDVTGRRCTGQAFIRLDHGRRTPAFEVPISDYYDAKRETAQCLSDLGARRRYSMQWHNERFHIVRNAAGPVDKQTEKDFVLFKLRLSQ